MSNINQDVQASHKILTLLEKANSQTEAILDGLPGVFIVFNTAYEILRANREAELLLKLAPEALLRSQLSALFKPVMWEIFLQNFQRMNKEGANCVKFELQVASEVAGSDKPYYWRLSRLHDHNQAEGGLFTLLGEDISQLRESESKLVNVFSNIPLGIMTLDEHGMIEDTYSSYVTYLFNSTGIAGKSFREVIFTPIEKQLTRDDIRGMDNVYLSLNREEAIFDSLQNSFPKQVFLPVSDSGKEGKYLGLSYKPVCYDGIVKRVLVIVDDRSAIVKAEEDQARASLIEKQSRAVYESAIRDSLTGLYTRFYMEDQAEALINNHNRRSINELSVIMFDLDHFKSVNDTYGHDTGDQVLKGVAAVILHQGRKSDIPVRYGGEEFLIFLPGDIESGRLLAERVRRGVESSSFVVEGHTIPVTISGGVAKHEPGETLQELIKKVDCLLYQAKKNGRNQIVSETN